MPMWVTAINLLKRLPFLQDGIEAITQKEFVAACDAYSAAHPRSKRLERNGLTKRKPNDPHPCSPRQIAE